MSLTNKNITLFTKKKVSFIIVRFNGLTGHAKQIQSVTSGGVSDSWLYICILPFVVISVYYIFLVLFQRLSIFDFSAPRPNIIITKARYRGDDLHPISPILYFTMVNILPNDGSWLGPRVRSLATRTATGHFLRCLKSVILAPYEWWKDLDLSLRYGYRNVFALGKHSFFDWSPFPTKIVFNLEIPPLVRCSSMFDDKPKWIILAVFAKTTFSFGD